MSNVTGHTERSDNDLLHYYLTDESYRSTFKEMGWLADSFVDHYHRSLFYYKHFYDDLCEYGNKSDCSEVIYFIPGFNGTPGQIRFGLPGILKKFGPEIYIKCLYLDEFSSKAPSWLKYNEANLAKRRDRIVADLNDLCLLAGEEKRLRVFVSSTAFYDFLSVYPRIKTIKDRITLYWGSCAPDSVAPSKWEGLFFRLNGFVYDGMKWYSYPNHRWLNKINPECAERHSWKYKGQRNVFYKNDLESRFFLSGILWDYVSTDCFNFLMDSNLRSFRETGERIDMEVRILAGTNDGFWDDSSVENIERTVDRYIVNRRILYKNASHLWVVTPENITELLDL